MTGIYANNVVRDLSGAGLGTTFESQKPEVAAVDAQGVVSPVAVGTAPIKVTNGGQVAHVVARVVASPAALPAPREVTSQVAISAGNFRRDPDTGWFVQSVIVTNTGAAAMALPLSIVVTGLPEGVLLENSSTKTRRVLPLGSSNLPLQADGSVLSPGLSATATLKFSNQGGGPITHQLRVFEGIRL